MEPNTRPWNVRGYTVGRAICCFLASHVAVSSAELVELDTGEADNGPGPKTFAEIPKFLQRRYIVPAEHGKVKPFDEGGRKFASEQCNQACINHTSCCWWSVRHVENWAEAKAAAGCDGVDQPEDCRKRQDDVRIYWEVIGQDWMNFQEVSWCLAELGQPGEKTLLKEPRECGLKDRRFRFGVVQEGADFNAIFTMNNRPGAQTVISTFKDPSGKGDFSFYVLVEISKSGFKIFDKTGKQHFDIHSVVELERADAFRNLIGVTASNEMTFVKSYVCGLFELNVSRDEIRRTEGVENLPAERANVNRCLPQASPCAAGSSCDREGHFEAVAREKWNQEYQVTDAGGAGGVPFARVMCAVFASVLLLLVVLVSTPRSAPAQLCESQE